jgi:diguanylate cyclase (GGDEF)-like protein
VGYVQENTDAIMGPLAMGFRHADGELRVLESYATNHYDDPRLGGLVVAVRDVTLQYNVNEALAKYTQGSPAPEIMQIFCHSLLGLPIRSRAAIVDATTGQPLANVGLPEDVFGAAPRGTPRRPWEEAVASGEGAFPGDLRDHDAALRAAIEREGLATMWAHPIGAPAADDPTGIPSSCLVMGRLERGEASINERNTVGMVARNVAMVLEREYLVGELNRRARTDALTGLGNRFHLFRARTDEDERSLDGGGRPTAALYIDLDDFKPVNDRHGHAAGDAVLVEVARRLHAVCRRDDELGRIGGDEFVMICWSVDGVDEATGIADRILASLAVPIDVPDQNGSGTVPVHIGASVGVALRHAHNGSGAPESLDQLLRRADDALYAAKRAGRNCWRLAS